MEELMRKYQSNIALLEAYMKDNEKKDNEITYLKDDNARKTDAIDHLKSEKIDLLRQAVEDGETIEKLKEDYHRSMKYSTEAHQLVGEVHQMIETEDATKRMEKIVRSSKPIEKNGEIQKIVRENTELKEENRRLANIIDSEIPIHKAENQQLRETIKQENAAVLRYMNQNSKNISSIKELEENKSRIEDENRRLAKQNDDYRRINSDLTAANRFLKESMTSNEKEKESFQRIIKDLTDENQSLISNTSNLNISSGGSNNISLEDELRIKELEEKLKTHEREKARKFTNFKKCDCVMLVLSCCDEHL
jgi:hypothetical protein